MNQERRATVRRHLVVYYVGALLLAIAGGLLMAAGQEAGGLLFILGPLLMVLVVRLPLRDGWADAGLRPNLRAAWPWYLFALLLYPLLFLLVIALNALLGFTTLTVPLVEWLPLLLAVTAAQLLPRMLFSLSEEFGWRGYMEPRLALLGMTDLPRHVLVGLLWGVWHFPLILGTDYTSVPLWIFLPLFLAATIFLAIIFGQMRKGSGSVWPPVLMHGMGNALGFALLEGRLIGFENELFGNIIPGALTITLAYGLIAWLVMRRRRALDGGAQQAAGAVLESSGLNPEARP